jgi:signal transduction histidine kinase
MTPRVPSPHRRPTLRGPSSRPPKSRSPIRAKHAVSRLAAELHDRVAQSLWSVDAEIASVLDVVPPTCDEARTRLVAVRDQVGRAYKDVRLTIGALRTDLPFQRDIAEALAVSLATFSRRTGVTTSMRSDNPSPPWTRLVELHVLAIVQQGLDNVAQHAQASHVVLSLDHVPNGWVVSLRDDGHGFPEAPPTNLGPVGHYGLAIMRERAESIGGELDIQSVPHVGTTLTLFVPDSARQ